MNKSISNGKMRICFFIYNISNAGGSERVTTIIANELKRRGYDISILSICGSKPFYELDKQIPIKIIYKDINNINSKHKYFQILRNAYKFHKSNKTDIIIDVFASRSLITIPLKMVLKIKNISWEHFNYNAKIGLNPLGRKLACKYSNKIITLTNEDTLLYKKDNKNMNAEIDYVYNPNPYEGSDVSDLSKKNIITVGRLNYQKGYDRLLKAWSLIENKCDYRLFIIGNGEERQTLEDEANRLKLKNLEFVGVTDKVEEYYKNSAFYVSTSRFEGLPMCMIEAQSFGLPIISFKCETGPSEIVEDNLSGYLIENEDCEILAKRMLELIKDKDKMKKMSIEAKRGSLRFNIDSIIDKWESIINNL